ncbi:MAG: hypothetical protein KDG52_14235 [Rhodocyclaceae bacterium]|nr:hypothetical protein [Rhodocyclaceae bacterium]
MKALVATSAFATPFDQGMVGTQRKSDVRIENVDPRTSADLGHAEQEADIGSLKQTAGTPASEISRNP